jgi:hypothetical protein
LSTAAHGSTISPSLPHNNPPLCIPIPRAATFPLSSVAHIRAGTLLCDSALDLHNQNHSSIERAAAEREVLWVVCLGACVIPVGEGPVPRMANKSALSMPSMGKWMGSADTGCRRRCHCWQRGFTAVLQVLARWIRAWAGMTSTGTYTLPNAWAAPTQLAPWTGMNLQYWICLWNFCWIWGSSSRR